MTKYVYTFGDGQADGDGTMKKLLGGKGANLAEMTSIGLPVGRSFPVAAPSVAEKSRDILLLVPGTPSMV